MKVLVTGATGFTGSRLVPLLLEQGLEVRCLVRPSSDTSQLPDGVCLVPGNLNNPGSLERALQGADTLVNLASLGFGHAPDIVRAAASSRVRRAVFISTTAIFTSLDAHSRSVRVAAEEIIRGSGLAYTILRPTMIYGSSRDRNMSRLIRYLLRWPVIPIAGTGRGLQQPVHVDDITRAVAQSLTSADAVNNSYNVPGATALSLDQVIDTVGRLLGRPAIKIHLPHRPVVAILRACERFSIRLPLKAEQVMRLEEDKTFDFSDAARDFGYRPRSFVDGIQQELCEMGLRDSSHP
ncbi:MAG TPA: NAD-dependent epimerase/dehydratase family protein [Acidobacteriota bacterium]|nr:NAD-dependent epimerase/dehydratase family protein [Acidobacteriota bacterium]